MKKILVLLALTLGFSSTITAQNSAEAKALLDDVYNKVKSYNNIQVDFKYVLNNAEAGINQETRGGDVTFKGGTNIWVTFFGGATQLFDGSKVYTIVPENEEVTIEDKSNDENALTPAKMLTFYRDGHNYEMDILQNVNGRKIQFVRLTPIDTNSEIKQILLGIDAETKHIFKVIELVKTALPPQLPLILSKLISHCQKPCLHLMRPNTKMTATTL